MACQQQEMKEEERDKERKSIGAEVSKGILWVFTAMEKGKEKRMFLGGESMNIRQP